jgi:hypothetical protein
VGKAQRAHHFKIERKSVGTLRFAHPTFFLVVMD